MVGDSLLRIGWGEGVRRTDEVFLPAWTRGRSNFRGAAAMGAGSIGGATPEGAPDGDAVIIFDEAMLDPAPPQVIQSIGEQGQFFRQTIAIRQRFKTRQLGGLGIHHRHIFHGIMS